MIQRNIILLLGIVALLFFASCEKTISGNGVVMDKTSGMPLKEATVNAYLDHPSPDTYQMQTTTDDQGRYFVSSDPQVCTGSCPDLYVEIYKDGYSSAIVKNPDNDTTWLSRK
jgi:hypothetical protein